MKGKYYFIFHHRNASRTLKYSPHTERQAFKILQRIFYNIERISNLSTPSYLLLSLSLFLSLSAARSLFHSLCRSLSFLHPHLLLSHSLSLYLFLNILYLRPRNIDAHLIDQFMNGMCTRNKVKIFQYYHLCTTIPDDNDDQ